MNIIDLGLKFIPERLAWGNVPKEGFLHHSGGIRSVQDYHQQHINQGWAGLAYHFAVDLDGKVYKGRPVESIPAGITGHNTNTLHIVAIGNFENMLMPDVQRESLKELSQYCKDTYNISFRGHKEVMATDCPGANYPLDGIKQGIVASRPIVQTPSPINNGIFKLQHILNQLGITDKWGNKLVEDGWIGEKTLSALYKVDVTRGMTSPLVGWIQERLGISVDNNYGNAPWHETYDAICNFQNSRGLKVDGWVGDNTWTELVK